MKSEERVSDASALLHEISSNADLLIDHRSVYSNCRCSVPAARAAQCVELQSLLINCPSVEFE